jgi:hypothetical protein
MIPTKSFPVGGEDDENKKQTMKMKIAFGRMISQQKRWVTLLYIFYTTTNKYAQTANVDIFCDAFSLTFSYTPQERTTLTTIYLRSY